jgi:arylamine N-acetyltransferase
MDLEAYLERIGVATPLEPDASTLHRLAYGHITAVPFENFSIYLGEPLDLSLDHLLKKIVEARRGGTCWELNHIFAALLTQLGYGVALLSAECWNKRARQFNPPFDHIVLQVEAPGEESHPWLVDVGYGAELRYPMKLADQTEVVDAGATYRLQEQGCYMVLTRHDPGETAVYRFRRDPSPIEDFTGMYLHRSTSPQSYFTRHWICTRANHDGWISLLDNEITLPDRERRNVANESDLRSELQRFFDIDLPADRSIRPPDGMKGYSAGESYPAVTE